MRVLFILSRILGGKTFSNALVSVVRKMSDIDPLFLFLDYGDLKSFKAPFLYRITNKFVSSQIARAKFEKIIKGNIRDFDCMFIQSFELLQGFKDIVQILPTILAHDSTNILGHWLVCNQNRGKWNIIKFYGKSILTTPVYWSSVKAVKIFMPRTSWCARSLMTHYRVASDRIIVAPGGLDLDLWKPRCKKTYSRPIKLLFVGNDFERKGGYFLLDLYTNFLCDDFELTLVSNDRCLDGTRFPHGVKLVRGISHDELERLVNLYSSSDIFVYPTRKDQLGLVLLEAAATGLPIIATDVGGDL